MIDFIFIKIENSVHLLYFNTRVLFYDVNISLQLVQC